MTELKLAKLPIARAGMLVHKPPSEVFEAFVDPTITTKFWFTHSTGRLEPGRHLHWEWEMYGAASNLVVKVLEPGRRIVLEWGLDDQPTTVEWTFTPYGDSSTFITITNSGFTGSAESVVEQALGSVEGFSLVLANFKAYLEYGINLNLIADRFPDQIIGRQKS